MGLFRGVGGVCGELIKHDRSWQDFGHYSAEGLVGAWKRLSLLAADATAMQPMPLQPFLCRQEKGPLMINGQRHSLYKPRACARAHMHIL